MELMFPAIVVGGESDSGDDEEDVEIETEERLNAEMEKMAKKAIKTFRKFDVNWTKSLSGRAQGQSEL